MRLAPTLTLLADAVRPSGHAAPAPAPLDDSDWGWECACPAWQCDGWDAAPQALRNPQHEAAATPAA